MNTKTFKASPESLVKETLQLPEFTLEVSCDDDGLYKGYVKEFSLWCFSQQEDETIAIKKIKDRSEDLVLSHIYANFYYNTINNLYLDDKLNRYNNAIIKNLKDAYEESLQNPHKLEDLFKSLSSNTTLYEMEEEKKYLLAAKKQLKELLDKLKQCSEKQIEEKREVFQTYIQVLCSRTSFYLYSVT